MEGKAMKKKWKIRGKKKNNENKGKR